jgi:hypothetical protein
MEGREAATSPPLPAAENPGDEKLMSAVGMKQARRIERAGLMLGSLEA